MKNYKTIVINQVKNNVETHVLSNVKYNVWNNGIDNVVNIVDITIFDNVWRNCYIKIIYIHKSFYYNYLQQYKDNL
jgi:hypothetical protein